MALASRSRLLRLPAGRLFAVVAGPWLAGVLLSGLALGLPLAGTALPDGLTTATLLTAAVLRASGRILLVLYLARVATGLPGRAPDNAANLSIAGGYLAAYSLAVCVLPVSLARDLPGAAAARYLSANAMQFGVFALASYVLLTYKAAVSLEVSEGYERQTAAGRLGDWLGFTIWVVGVWALQPRVRAAAGREEEVALEDHLLE